MPNASTGGTGDRASQEDARSPGTAPEGLRAARSTRLQPGEVRIDSFDQYGNVVFTTSYGVVRDQLVETRADSTYGNRMEMTYTFLSGLTWRGDRPFAPGLVTHESEFGYSNAGYGPRPEFIRRDDGRIPEALCGCDVCVSRRAGDPYLDQLRLRQERQRFAWTQETQVDRLRRERMQRVQQERQREQQERVRRMQEAEKRAEETLKLVLLPDELKEYEKSGKIVVTGSDKRRYLIGPGTVSNVQLMDSYEKKSLASLCCHPAMYSSGNYNEPLPDRDAHVAQILYLRYDLEKFWDTANIYWHDAKAQAEYFDGLTRRRRLQERTARLAERLRR